MNVTVECSRCHNKIDGIIDNGVTGGFYDVQDGSGWELYANPREDVLCDTCMHQDYRYRSVYMGESIVDEKEQMTYWIDNDYTVKSYKYNNLYHIEITDGNPFNRHQEHVADGTGTTIKNAILHAYLQWMHWYDKRISHQ